MSGLEDNMSSQSDWMEEPDIDIDLSDRTLYTFSEEGWYYRLKDRFQGAAAKKKIAIFFAVAAGLVALTGIIFVVVFASKGSSRGPSIEVDPLASYTVPEGFFAFQFAGDLNRPRGMWVDPSNNDVLVVESGAERVTVLWDADGDGLSGSSERAILVSAPDLSHAILVKDGYLYASSVTTVYRWPYVSGERQSITAPAEIVVQGMETKGHHSRTMLFDKSNKFYVQEGSRYNVDDTPSRALIRRFDLSNGVPEGGFGYSTGEIFAIGLRNEVGLRMDADGRIWGVENGCDDLARTDLGGDIHQTNPAEEINLFIDPKNTKNSNGKFGYNDTSARFYGYPYCWSEFDLPPTYAKGRLEQWVHPNFMEQGPSQHTDEWCRDPRNVVKPAFGLPAHSAPLDLYFYYGKTFPKEYVGDMFVSLHGSWDAQPPVGYKVVRVRFNETKLPYEFESFLQYDDPNHQSSYPHRPVALELRKCPWGECLLVSSDFSGTILAVTHKK